MVIQHAPVTMEAYEQFIALPENADRRFELINGEIVEKVPTELHGEIAYLLAGYLFMFTREHKLGRGLVEARYRNVDDEENSFIPDLSFRRNPTEPALEEGAIPIMPDLAVEIQSPGQGDKLMSTKAAYYLANGSRLVWIVYPRKRLIEVLTPTDRHLLTIEDTLDGGDVLPGFSLPIAALFSER